LSLVQSGTQVLMRAQDAKPATFFVGERYPVTLSLLSGSLGSTPFVANPGGTGVTIPTQQFTVGKGPVAMVPSDLRSAGIQDLAVLNEIDNTITIFLKRDFLPPPLLERVGARRFLSVRPGVPRRRFRHQLPPVASMPT